MNSKLLAAIAASAIVAAPLAASAQDAIAASLSASFGTNAGTVAVDGSDLSGTITAPTSISVAGAAGNSAVASAVANSMSSGAAAGATNVMDLAPMADVSARGGIYETSVAFAPTNFDEIAEMAAADAIAALCAAGFSVTPNLTTVDQTSVFGTTRTANVNGTIDFEALGCPTN